MRMTREDVEKKLAEYREQGLTVRQAYDRLLDELGAERQDEGDAEQE